MKIETNKMMKGLCAFAAIFALAACTGKSSNNPAPAVTPQEEGVNNDGSAPAPDAGAGEVAPAPEAGLPSSGNAVATMEVTGSQILGEADQVITREDLLGRFPMLAEKTTWLSSIDKVVKTDANTWEFYTAGQLILILGTDAAGQIIVINSVGGFTADMITHSEDAAEQKEMSHHLTFLLSECTAPEKEEPKQDEKQEEKQEEQKQEEGGKMAATGAKEEAPVKETPKEEEKQEEKVCGAVKFVLHFKEVIQDKEQEQKQEEQKDEKQAPEDQKQAPEDQKQAPVAPAPEEDQKQAPEDQKQAPVAPAPEEDQKQAPEDQKQAPEDQKQTSPEQGEQEQGGKMG